MDQSKVDKYCMDSGLDESQSKSLIAALTLLTTNFVKYSIDDTEFMKELLQLGLSQEIAESILTTINKEKPNIANAFMKQSFRIN